MPPQRLRYDRTDLTQLDQHRHDAGAEKVVRSSISSQVEANVDGYADTQDLQGRSYPYGPGTMCC